MKASCIYSCLIFDLVGIFLLGELKFTWSVAVSGGLPNSGRRNASSPSSLFNITWAKIFSYQLSVILFFSIPLLYFNNKNLSRWLLQSLAVLSIYSVEGDIAVQCPSRLELAIYSKMILKLEHLEIYQTSMIYVNSVAFMSTVQILDNFEGLEAILQGSFRPGIQNWPQNTKDVVLKSELCQEINLWKRKRLRSKI